MYVCMYVCMYAGMQVGTLFVFTNFSHSALQEELFYLELVLIVTPHLVLCALIPQQSKYLQVKRAFTVCLDKYWVFCKNLKELVFLQR